MTYLLYGAPEHSADFFHAVPVGIIDPFLYVEDGVLDPARGTIPRVTRR